MALLNFMEIVGNASDKNLVTLGVFIDLKKAFDTIDHVLLLDKLYYYGIKGIAGDWLKSYLFNHKQFVNVNGVKSDQLNVVCDVPQGSILGPKLFILYINDICNTVEPQLSEPHGRHTIRSDNRGVRIDDGSRNSPSMGYRVGDN